MLRSKFIFFISALLMGQVGHAGGIGFNVGFGLPYTMQGGVNWMSSSNKLSAELAFNQFSLGLGSSSISLTKPELKLNWHPFAGSFFIGVGLGQMTVNVTTTESGQTVNLTSVATTMTPTLGWMWGASNGGFFAGMDFGMQMPSNPTTTVTPALPGVPAYDNAVAEGNKYAAANLSVFTAIRLGYLF